MAKGELSRRKEQAIECLLREASTKKAAESAGVSYRCLRNWLREPAFLAAYRRARRELVEEGMGFLQKLAQNAVVCLGRNLTCKRPGDEIRAAVAILDHAYRALETFDLVERLEAVEKTLARKKI
jgi:hypothetical protein